MPDPTAPATKPSRPLTRKDLLDRLSVATGFARNSISAVLDALAQAAEDELRRPDGPGICTVPGIVKLRVMKRGASPARTLNGPRGTPVTVPAKPERKAVHAKVYDPLKRAVAQAPEAAP